MCKTAAVRVVALGIGGTAGWLESQVGEQANGGVVANGGAVSRRILSALRLGGAQ